MTEPAPPRRLYRSRDNRMLGGVAGGLADYLDVDSALVRLGFVALFFAAGAGVLAYIIAWIVIPEEPRSPAVAAATPLAASLPAAASAPTRRGSAGSRGARLLIGAILVAIGVFLLFDWALPALGNFIWPGAIIVLGLGLLAYGARR
jgi:phage shock protein C